MSVLAKKSEKVQRWLGGFCTHQNGVRSAVVLLGTEATLAEAAHWPESATASKPLVAAARASLKRNRALAITPPVAVGTAQRPGRILSLPLARGSNTLGAMAVAVQEDLDTPDERLLRELTHSGAALSALLLHTAEQPAPNVATALLLRLQALLLKPYPFDQAASALVTELASLLKFERVSLGLLQDTIVQVVALSHSADMVHHQALIRALAAAMHEAIDQHVALHYPLAPEEPPRIIQAHAALAAQAPGSILTLPLINNKKCIGAVCFEYNRTITTEEQHRIEHFASALTPIIDLKQRAEQSWWVRARHALHAYWGDVQQRKRRMLWIGGCVAALLLSFIPLTHHIGAPVRLEGKVQRVLAAPTDGFLYAAHVRPGDAVAAGQILAELAQEDLVLENRKLEAELAQHENTAAAALARADRTEYAVAQARAAEAHAQLELVQSQLARTQLTAPIDGVVIKGDLSQLLGAPVQRGEVLLTLAPSEDFRVIIEVDERDIGSVITGQQGQLVLSAMPSQRLDFTVTRISPVAVTNEEGNAFEVEATFKTRPPGLRPGLQGIAKINAPSRPLAWIATHRISDWIKLKTWGWTG